MSAANRPSRPPLVLIANDQEWSARSLESVLGPQGYAVIRAYTGKQAVEVMRTAHPDALIIDDGLPDVSGAELCTQLRQDARFSLNTPIIVTCPDGDTRAQRTAAYNAGAWDFCSQPIDMDVLLRKLETYVQAKLASDQTRDESLIDQETGLYNMRGLARRAREIGAELSRRSDGLSCVAFAPDHETVAFSETAGDDMPRLAEHISTVCRGHARVSDAVGRLGPNEYAIIAPATPETGAARLVERLRNAFEANPLRIGGAERRVGLLAATTAVANLADSPVDTLELLYRATASLRQSRTSSPALPLPNVQSTPAG